MIAQAAVPPATRKTALVFFVLPTILVLAGVSWLLVPGLTRYLQARHARQVFDSGAMMQERRIYNACLAFDSVRGTMPGSLDDLVPDFLPDAAALRDPDHPKAGEIGYRYYASGSTGTEPPTAIFLATKAIMH